MTTATKTETFTRAIRVNRSNTGCYEFCSTEDRDFADVVRCDDTPVEWEIVDDLIGWGDWTHVILAKYGDWCGDVRAYYFVR